MKPEPLLLNLGWLLWLPWPRECCWSGVLGLLWPKLGHIKSSGFCLGLLECSLFGHCLRESSHQIARCACPMHRPPLKELEMAVQAECQPKSTSTASYVSEPSWMASPSQLSENSSSTHLWTATEWKPSVKSSPAKCSQHMKPWENMKSSL